MKASKAVQTRFEALARFVRSEHDDKPEAYREAGKTPGGFRWAAVFFCQRFEEHRTILADCYAEGLNDTHISTALRAAFRKTYGADQWCAS